MANVEKKWVKEILKYMVLTLFLSPMPLPMRGCVSVFLLFSLVDKEKLSVVYIFALPVLVIPLIASLTLENLLELGCSLGGVIVRRPLVLATVSNSAPAIK